MLKSMTLAVVLLTGCASLPEGLQMDEDERKACAVEGCSVWTMDELRKLIGISMQRGYEAGKRSL